MTLEVNLVRTVPSAKFILTTLISFRFPSSFVQSYLASSVVLNVICEHFIWQLTMQPAKMGFLS